MKIRFVPLFASLALGQVHGQTFPNEDSGDLPAEAYDVVILGGGFSGLYSAMRLGQASGGTKRIAIVEALETNDNYKDSGLPLNGIPAQDACLGGRIQDYPFDCPPEREGCPAEGKVWFGLGPVRYKTSTGNFFLANELGFQPIEEESSTYGEAEGFIGHNRGTYFSGGAFAGGQKLLDEAYDASQLFSPSFAQNFLQLFSEEGRAEVCDRQDNLYHSMRQYMSGITGASEGYESINAAIRFKSLWIGDAQGMLEWIDTDSFKSDEGWAVYPEGSLSAFIRAFYKEIVDNDYADIMCGAKVESVDSEDGTFTVNIEGGKTITGTQVINTIPQLNHQRIGGNVFDALNAQKEASLLQPIEAVTCTAQYAERWWDDLVPVGEEANGVEGPVDTWYSTYNCMQQMEDFNSAYTRPSNAVRVLYVDDSPCSQYWKRLIEGTDEEVVGKEIQARLSEFFKMEVPREEKLVCKIYSADKVVPESGWHFLGVGSTYTLGNNPSAAFEEWGMQPMPDEFENFFMCGEGYTVRHGWTDGCRANCDMMLHEKMGVGTEYLPQYDFSLNTRGACSAMCEDPNVGIDETCDFPDRAILKSR